MRTDTQHQIRSSVFEGNATLEGATFRHSLFTYYLMIPRSDLETKSIMYCTSSHIGIPNLIWSIASLIVRLLL